MYLAKTRSVHLIFVVPLLPFKPTFSQPVSHNYQQSYTLKKMLRFHDKVRWDRLIIIMKKKTSQTDGF